MISSEIASLVGKHDTLDATELWRAITKIPPEAWDHWDTYTWLEENDVQADLFLKHAFATTDADTPEAYLSKLASQYLLPLVHMPDSYNISIDVCRRHAYLRVESALKMLEENILVCGSPDADLTEEQAAAEAEILKEALSRLQGAESPNSRA